ncbi:hypothetical protein [Paraflavitalea speifideaquila]|uniref:hypothetical protein n=1 Tax=Paraflavitalea speifideaquila TaxID=3076558 RepID=UPI0028EA6DC8|nr:hypothetical protein [Paraflavitalea speifideiaquila]
MDKKLIQQYGEDILSYRLRTARQKKRMQYEDFDKQLLRLHREHNSLDQQIEDLGWEPLDPTIQRGWNRFFVLRDDIARSKHAEFYENLLQKINTSDWSYRRDFKIHKRRYGKGKYQVKGQNLKEPSESEFMKMDLTERGKHQFHEVYSYDWRHRLEKRYVFNEPWRFVLRVRPNMITRIKRSDTLIEARMDAIEDYLEWNELQRRLNKIMHGHTPYKYHWPAKPNVYQYKNKSLSQIMDLIRET